MSAIPVVDLFAGPGGLGEGFSSLGQNHRGPKFKICLSIERDQIAHQTLQLRAFYRQFKYGGVPNQYYDFLRGEIALGDLYKSSPQAASSAASESWCAELGAVDTALVRKRIHDALRGETNWVLIGGPPCQAYSLVGRSRNKGITGYSLADDPKAKLYLQYLQIIADFWPPVFVMENVKGLLSSRIDGELVFNQIRRDLQDPATAIRAHRLTRRNARAHTYTLRTLTQSGLFDSPADFVIRAEKFGIPQARHRVIVVGIRDDLDANGIPMLSPREGPTVEAMLRDLPPLRSGLSKEEDSPQAWVEAVLELCESRRIRSLQSTVDSKVVERLHQISARTSEMLRLGRGSEFIYKRASLKYENDWFIDEKLKGVCNHSSRTHIRADLQRYAFAAAFADVLERSPNLSEFPRDLLPNHGNVANGGTDFADRFRVQHRHRYATTITSHIGKDGHYYIHYSPEQCRSLTVREAARLQTFPDNYFFTGPRTAQYVQVGNAVPPLLARQIAASVHSLLAN